MKNFFIELLEKHALAMPDKLFLVDTKEKITFSQALKIIQQKAEDYPYTNKPVIIKVDRSANTILDFLAVLYSNNFYIPIDCDSTADKINLIKKQINTIDTKQFSDILYVIFTSGSTGVPKGVVKSCENMKAFVENFVETFKLDNNEVMANQSPFMFDASAKDIYLSLYLGATLHILPKELFSFPSSLITYLNENKVTYISWVPSALIVLARLKALNTLKMETIKRVFFVGEVFPTKYINYFLDKMPDVQFTNTYGSSETAGIVLYYNIPKGKKLDETKPLPMGKALHGNNVYIDQSGQVIVESNQVALGYVNDPERNEQTFIGEKTLRTGDYARYDEDGNIVFTTRKDFQIKHMGYRIELQEIEHYANSLPYIDISVCIYNNEVNKILLVVVPNSTISRENVVAQTILDLKKLLPFYMVPNKVVLLDNVELNANGKLDRQKIKEKIYG